MKEKDGQLLRLKEVNKELRKINKSSSVQDSASIKANLDEVKTQLAHRDKEFKVRIESLQHATSIFTFRIYFDVKICLRKVTEDN